MCVCGCVGVGGPAGVGDSVGVGVRGSGCVFFFLPFCLFVFVQKFFVYDFQLSKTPGGVFSFQKKKKQKTKSQTQKTQKIENLESHAHTPARAHTPHAQDQNTPKCANASAHDPRMYAHTTLFVKEFKSEQFTSEIGPKGPERTKKVVPAGMLDSLSFYAFFGRFQK